MAHLPVPRTAGGVFALIAIVALSGCGVLEEARQAADKLAAEHAARFDTATRVQLDSDPEGRTFLLRVAARSEAHWYEAMAAMSRDLGTYCADGVPFSVRRMAPAHDPRANPPGEYTRHPGGTMFEQEIHCSDPFAGQRVVAADVDDTVALAALKAELVGESVYDSSRHLYATVGFNDRNPKYRAISETIGSMMMGTNRRCRDAGVHVQRLLVHAKPTPAASEGVFLNRAEAYVGIDAVCADALPADPRS